MIAVKGRVTGRVQGVGFRYFTQEQASLQGLSGYVRNEHDGSVEFLLQGPEVNVNAMLEKLKQGPRFSKVETCEYSSVDPDVDLQRFDIKY